MDKYGKNIERIWRFTVNVIRAVFIFICVFSIIYMLLWVFCDRCWNLPFDMRCKILEAKIILSLLKFLVVLTWLPKLIVKTILNFWSILFQFFLYLALQRIGYSMGRVPRLIFFFICALWGVFILFWVLCDRCWDLPFDMRNEILVTDITLFLLNIGVFLIGVVELILKFILIFSDTFFLYFSIFFLFLAFRILYACFKKLIFCLRLILDFADDFISFVFEAIFEYMERWIDAGWLWRFKAFGLAVMSTLFGFFVSALFVIIINGASVWSLWTFLALTSGYCLFIIYEEIESDPRSINKPPASTDDIEFDAVVRIRYNTKNKNWTILTTRPVFEHRKERFSKYPSIRKFDNEEVRLRLVLTLKIIILIFCGMYILKIIYF